MPGPVNPLWILSPCSLDLGGSSRNMVMQVFAEFWLRALAAIQQPASPIQVLLEHRFRSRTLLLCQANKEGNR